jgi:hypothetical protein
MQLTIKGKIFTQFDFSSDKAIIDNNNATRFYLVINENTDEYDLYNSVDSNDVLNIEFVNDAGQVHLFEGLRLTTAVYDFTGSMLRLHFEKE